jgi:hypothetical protein
VTIGATSIITLSPLLIYKEKLSLLVMYNVPDEGGLGAEVIPVGTEEVGEQHVSPLRSRKRRLCLVVDKVSKAEAHPVGPSGVSPPQPSVADSQSAQEMPKVLSAFGGSFDPIAFINNHLLLKSETGKFDAMDPAELRKLALGYEFKDLVLNHVLSGRQEKRVEEANQALQSEVERLNTLHEAAMKELMDKHKEELEEKVRLVKKDHEATVGELLGNHSAALMKAKACYESMLEALKKVYESSQAREVRNLTKAHNGLIVYLAQASEVVADLEDDVADLGEENKALKKNMADKYVDGFALAIAQVKVLFPDLNDEVLA